MNSKGNNSPRWPFVVKGGSEAPVRRLVLSTV
jgi:hypothetical protein